MPQILTLLNGPMFYHLMNRRSVMQKNLAEAKSPEEKLEVIYLSILSRRPTEREKKIALPSIQENAYRGTNDVVWALLNTRQFMFVQ